MRDLMRDALVVSIGTKAQFIKMAPVLLALDARGIPYRLVYTGQHSETFDALERAFGTRAPDDNLVPAFEAATHASFARWTLAFWRASLRRDRRAAARATRITVVHGDTVSALFAALAARLAGGKVAHIEAGLRSPHLRDPFPEEIVRRWVSRLARLHFAPDATAVANLRAVRGDVVDTQGNTLRDALAFALRARDLAPERGAGGYAVVSMHRNENLSQPAKLRFLLRKIVDCAQRVPVRFVLHPATRERLRGDGLMSMLEAAPGVSLLERMNHAEFIDLLLDATFLFTDGGSNQEEAAMLGLPTLLLRRATERPDGLGENVTLSRLDEASIDAFVERYAGQRWRLRLLDPGSPSERIVDVLQRELS